MVDARGALYTEAGAMLRSCDSLSFSIIQYYGAFYGAVLAFGRGPDGLGIPLGAARADPQVGIILIVLSIVGFLLTARLRRNYTYFQDVCKAIESELTPEAGQRPQAHAEAELKRIDSRHALAFVPSKHLYSLIYIAGAGFAAALAGLVPAL